MVEKNKADNRSEKESENEKKRDSEKKATTEGDENARIQKNKSRASKRDEAELNTAQSPTEFPMTLEEFCTRLSQDNAQVELIGGFYAHETHSAKNTTAGGLDTQLMDTQLNFKARFDTFCQ
ncbi:MAG TPA: hypothetical protein ENJ08_12195, partial [Gammaproteobacteria bacterium]|nr:hypothetical protein [Gammaproteobacteria bacterium]